MSIVNDDVKLVIEVATFALAVGAIIWRTSSLATKLDDDRELRKTEISEIKAAIGGRMDKVEMRLDQMQTIMISEARQDERIKSIDERIAAMDQRSLAQGQRIDSTASIINGRLEAINNIVSGHTAQLNNLGRKTA